MQEFRLEWAADNELVFHGLSGSLLGMSGRPGIRRTGDTYEIQVFLKTYTETLIY